MSIDCSVCGNNLRSSYILIQQRLCGLLQRVQHQRQRRRRVAQTKQLRYQQQIMRAPVREATGRRHGDYVSRSALLRLSRNF